MLVMASALGLGFCLFTFFCPFFKGASFFARVVVLKFCMISFFSFFLFGKEGYMVKSLEKLAVMVTLQQCNL